MSRKTGCLTALVGCAIGAMTAYVMGYAAVLTYHGDGDGRGFVALAVAGGVFGVTFFIIGIVKAVSGEEDQSPDSFYKNPRTEKLCPNCHFWVARGSKICEWCGADVK